MVIQELEEQVVQAVDIPADNHTEDIEPEEVKLEEIEPSEAVEKVEPEVPESPAEQEKEPVATTDEIRDIEPKELTIHLCKTL